MSRFRIAVLSDVHYACAAEQARVGYELEAATSAWQRTLVRVYRDHIWLRDAPFQNHLLDRFIVAAGQPDLVVSNGDHTCDTAFVGVADDAACRSVEECLGQLRAAFGDRLLANMGDHELGKISLLGRRGGLRLESLRRSVGTLGIPGFWERDLGSYKLVGVASSVIAFPLLEPESLAEERPGWWAARAELTAQLRESFGALRPGQRVILFCHDPSALPFLAEDAVIGPWLGRIEATILGHLHSPLIFWHGRLLAGIPPVAFLGTTVRRITRALNQGRSWKPFKPLLCPSLAGIELLKDGGHLTLELDLAGREPLRITRHRLRR